MACSDPELRPACEKACALRSSCDESPTLDADVASCTHACFERVEKLETWKPNPCDEVYLDLVKCVAPLTCGQWRPCEGEDDACPCRRELDRIAAECPRLVPVGS